jgi:hypothetical protein
VARVVFRLPSEGDDGVLRFLDRLRDLADGRPGLPERAPARQPLRSP